MELYGGAVINLRQESWGVARISDEIRIGTRVKLALMHFHTSSDGRLPPENVLPFFFLQFLPHIYFVAVTFSTVNSGETSLADSSRPLRTVNVVTVRIIGKDNRVLVESRQELSDGSVRDRFRPLSEKVKPGENPEEAAIRAVKEELGSIIGGGFGDGGVVKIVPGSYQKKVEERNSVSYPGLPACYVLHSLDAWVEGLPEGEFCSEEEQEYEDADGSRTQEKAVSVRKHYSKWVSPVSTHS
ncbi:hypothetical protein SLEP1_g57476 [Rubroshorea leprosula]|uniref:Nudix hydrolase domain-containing protein n=1 Tax=Rubroshorea leprosula TaxID=152421 RepID=A0AAV5MLC2_9ROSI|nr:hypothetical protein SLEP1_g57476 [Rubroshorea leprosula]